MGGQTKFAGGGASADLRESDWSVNSTARSDERYHSSRERYRARAHLRQNARAATKQELSLLGPACLGAAWFVCPVSADPALGSLTTAMDKIGLIDFKGQRDAQKYSQLMLYTSAVRHHSSNTELSTPVCPELILGDS